MKVFVMQQFTFDFIVFLKSWCFSTPVYTGPRQQKSATAIAEFHNHLKKVCHWLQFSGMLFYMLSYPKPNSFTNSMAFLG